MSNILNNCGVVGCWGTDSLGRKTLNGQLFDTKKNQEQQAVMQVQLAQQQAQQQAISDAQKNNTKEPIYYILVTAGVIIAGYFAYKKFKK
jgi:hypothetical protein